MNTARYRSLLRNRARNVAVVLLLVLVPAGVVAQDNSPATDPLVGDSAAQTPFSVSLYPAYHFTMNPPDAWLYKTGMSGALGITWRIPGLPWLVLSGNVGSTWITLNNQAGTLHLGSLGLAAGVEWKFFDRFTLHASLGGGPFVAALWDAYLGTMEWSGFLLGSLGLSYRVLPWLSVSVDEFYRGYFGLSLHDFGLGIGATFHLGSTARVSTQPRRIEPVAPEPEPLGDQVAERSPDAEQETEATEEPQVVVAVEPKPQPQQEPEPESEAEIVTAVATTFGTLDLQMEPVFPVFFSYYDSHPVGTATIANAGEKPIEDVTISFYVAQYMDNPKESRSISRIEPESEMVVDIYSLFTSQILEITEGTKVSALVTLDYILDGEDVSEEFVETIDVNNRNALTWDDDQKISAFVTAKDPAVMRFARNISGHIQDQANRGVNGNLMAAMGIHEALDRYGLHYIPDPTTPYTELSQESLLVDYLLFPRQTLEFQGGDCDDLSALYCALFESLGVETAFITIPGHIYMAFNLGIDPDQARSEFTHPDELIFRDGTSWVPIEITSRDEGFLTAWQLGAKEWRENSAAGQAGFYPVHQGWEVYQPVGLPGTSVVNPPDGQAVAAAFSAELLGFIEREIATEVATVQAQIDSDARNPRWPNKLGVLYARYGVDDRAVPYFEGALRLRENYVPALVNLGNIYYLSDDVYAALDYYEAAENVAPENPAVLLSIARANHDIENYGTARRAYAKLREVSPSLANRFSYLDLRGDEAQRAAEAGDVADLIYWSDEGGEE